MENLQGEERCVKGILRQLSEEFLVKLPCHPLKNPQVRSALLSNPQRARVVSSVPRCRSRVLAVKRGLGFWTVGPKVPEFAVWVSQSPSTRLDYSWKAGTGPSCDGSQCLCWLSVDERRAMTKLSDLEQSQHLFRSCTCVVTRAWLAQLGSALLSDPRGRGHQWLCHRHVCREP